MTKRNAADVVNYPGDKLDKAYINLWNFIAEGLIINGVPREHIAIGGTDSVIESDCYSYAVKQEQQAVWHSLECYKSANN